MLEIYIRQVKNERYVSSIKSIVRHKILLSSFQTVTQKLSIHSKTAQHKINFTNKHLYLIRNFIQSSNFINIQKLYIG